MIPYYLPCAVEEEKKIDLNEYFELDVNSQQSTARSSSIYIDFSQHWFIYLKILLFFLVYFFNHSRLLTIKPMLTLLSFITLIDVSLCEHFITFYDVIKISIMTSFTAFT